MTERWLPVVGFEGLYEVSDLGRVKSRARFVRTKGNSIRSVAESIRLVKPAKNGYLNINLCREGLYTYTTVHALVLEAFRGAPAAGQEARHRNGVRVDCRLDNLEWGTRLENMRDQYAHGTRIRGERHPLAKLTGEFVSWIRESGQSGIELAHSFGVNVTTICKARRGETHVVAC